MFNTLKKIAFAAAASSVLLTSQAQAVTFTTGLDEADVAVSTCWSATGFASVEFHSVADDGMGGFTIWLSDQNETLFLCNADAAGDVYVFEQIGSDMFNGQGQAALSEAGYTEISNAVENQPQAVANSTCVLPFNGATEIVASVPDGLGDYLVWLTDSEDGLWMCNASGAAEVYTLIPVEGPVISVGGMQQA